jgi:hypothetical protein
MRSSAIPVHSPFDAVSHARLANGPQASAASEVTNFSGTGGAGASPCQLAPCKRCAADGQACAECWPSYGLRGGFCLRE